MVARINKCLHCDKELIQGRSDRKYCDNSCRSNYHYAMKLRKTKAIQELLINSKLKCFMFEKLKQIRTDMDKLELQRTKKGSDDESGISLKIEKLRLYTDMRAVNKILTNLEVISSD